MSKAIYDDVQSFLAECWGPCAGWAQAVMFAKAVQADASSRVAPRKTDSAEVKKEEMKATAIMKRASEQIIINDGVKRTRRATRGKR